MLYDTMSENIHSLAFFGDNKNRLIDFLLVTMTFDYLIKNLRINSTLFENKSTMSPSFSNKAEQISNIDVLCNNGEIEKVESLIRNMCFLREKRVLIMFGQI